MKEATYVAISTQKGGAGKTTLTVLVASYLHYVKGYNVAVVDCDFPQYSIHDMRKRDLKAVIEDGHYKMLAYEQLKRLKKNPYTIRCSRAEDAIRTAENLTDAQPDLDFVFFDLPGTINKAYDKVCAEFALPILETFLPDSKRFRKETAAERKAVFRSTAFPADKALVRGSNLDKLVDEILGIIKN